VLRQAGSNNNNVSLTQDESFNENMGEDPLDSSLCMCVQVQGCN
jgi:hypothetical protein